MTLPDIRYFHPDTAMVLAAGLGKRMRPLSEHTPKPLIKVGGRALIDHALSRINEANITKAVVNVHYLADMIEDYLAPVTKPHIVISDERDALLETAGGIKKALPLIGSKPFIIFNSDSLWLEPSREGEKGNMERLISRWNPEIMDILLLLVEQDNTVCFDGAGDYFQDQDGRLTRRSYATHAPLVYAGVAIAKPELFPDIRRGAVSLIEIFDRVQGRRRLFGHVLNGHWLHVGTPDAIREAEEFIQSYYNMT